MYVSVCAPASVCICGLNSDLHPILFVIKSVATFLKRGIGFRIEFPDDPYQRCNPFSVDISKYGASE